MKLLVAGGKLVIQDHGNARFVLVPCHGHGYHIKPVAEAAPMEVPRELTMDEVHTLISFIANGFV